MNDSPEIKKIENSFEELIMFLIQFFSFLIFDFWKLINYFLNFFDFFVISGDFHLIKINHDLIINFKMNNILFLFLIDVEVMKIN